MDLKDKSHEMLHNAYGPDAGDKRMSSHQRGWKHGADYQGRGQDLPVESFHKLWVGCTSRQPAAPQLIATSFVFSAGGDQSNQEGHILRREATAPTHLMD